MSQIVSGGIVQALAVFLQTALAFHRHIGKGPRESRGLLAKELDREIALGSFRFCKQFSVEPGLDSFPTSTMYPYMQSTWGLHLIILLAFVRCSRCSFRSLLT